MNTDIIANMTTAEIVAEYNSLTGSSVKRFSDRKTAERRLKAARLAVLAGTKEDASKPVATAEIVDTASRADELKCPSCGDSDGNITYAGPEGTAAGERLFCHHCSTEFYANGRIYKAPAKSKTRSENVAASWEDPDVAADRKVRCTNVTVRHPDGDLYSFKSVPQAFKFLGLPWWKHFSVRKQVKAGQTVEVNGYWFAAGDDAATKVTVAAVKA